MTSTPQLVSPDMGTTGSLGLPAVPQRQPRATIRLHRLPRTDITLHRPARATITLHRLRPKDGTRLALILTTLLRARPASKRGRSPRRTQVQRFYRCTSAQTQVHCHSIHLQDGGTGLTPPLLPTRRLDLSPLPPVQRVPRLPAHPLQARLHP